MLVKDLPVTFALKPELICLPYYNFLDLKANLVFYGLLLKKLPQLVLAATL
jgi:hypothetical protein